MAISSLFSLLEERDRKISKCHFSFLVEAKASGDAASPRGRLRVVDPVLKLFFEHVGGFGFAPSCGIWAFWLRVASPIDLKYKGGPVSLISLTAEDAGTDSLPVI